MRYHIFFAIGIGLTALLSACVAKPTTSRSTSTPTITPDPTPMPDSQTGYAHPLILAHYMPWYEAPPQNNWGFHWTGGGAFTPDDIDENGQADIASQVHPLTDPYDSRDAAILEYQTLLMKIAGIDGVIADWYGNKAIYDYGAIHSATDALLQATENAGLSFTVCYEDRTVSAMINGGLLESEAALEHGQETMQFLQENWFRNKAWLRYDNRPLLFIFGPIHYLNAGDWETIFANLSERPYFITLDNKVATAADATYPWVPMHMATSGVVSPARWQAYLNAFYASTAGDDLRIGGAFPQFHDIYAEIGTESSYGYLDPLDGETFSTSLQMAVDANVDIIQLITWNDYGEGTVVEPTVEFGYTYLEAIQAQQIAWQGDAFPYTADDLRLPLRIFELRHAGTDNHILDTAVAALYSGDPAGAKALLDSLD